MPGLKTEIRTIDGLELRCTQFQSMHGFGLVPRVSVLSAFTIKRAAEKGVSGNEPLSALLPIVFDVAIGLTAEEIQQLARDLLPDTEAKIDGDWIRLNSDKAINLAFEGALPTLFRAILFSVEVNFLSFFVAAQPASDPGGAAEEKPAA
jgi:hypothetical protein